MRGSECPFCGSGETVKRGEGRRLCKSCRRSFRASTSTVMSSMKLDRERFRKMANLMLNDVKLKAIIDSVGISTRTAYVWRMKIYGAAFEIQKKAMLSGKCWIDEALVPVNEGVCFRLEGGKKPRGVSRNQAVIACAVDSFGNRIAIEAGRGHITSAACIRTYGAHIKKGSLVVHDGIFSHDRLISFLKSPDEVYKSTTRESDPKLQPVNSFIAELQHFLRCHVGIRTDFLDLRGVDSLQILREGGRYRGQDRPSGIVLLPDEGQFQGKRPMPRGLIITRFVNTPIIQKGKKERMLASIELMRKEPDSILQWSKEAWMAMVENAIVHIDKTISFNFYCGRTIKV